MFSRAIILRAAARAGQRGVKVAASGRIGLRAWEGKKRKYSVVMWRWCVVGRLRMGEGLLQSLLRYYKQ